MKTDFAAFMQEPGLLKAGDEITCFDTADCKRCFKAMQKLGIKGRMSEEKPLTIVVLEDEVITWR